MEKKIKQFFQKKKVEAKFKLAGPGHKLTESTTSSRTSAESKSEATIKRSGLTTESKVAAEAALARLSLKRENPSFNTSYAHIQVCVLLFYVIDSLLSSGDLQVDAIYCNKGFCSDWQLVSKTTHKNVETGVKLLIYANIM